MSIWRTFCKLKRRCTVIYRLSGVEPICHANTWQEWQWHEGSCVTVMLWSLAVVFVQYGSENALLRERQSEDEWEGGEVEYINRPVMTTAEGDVRRKPRPACSSAPSRTADYVVPPGRILRGQLRPSAGCIRVGGKPEDHEAESAQDLSLQRLPIMQEVRPAWWACRTRHTIWL